MVTNIFLGISIALLPLFLITNGNQDTTRGTKDLIFLYAILALLSLMRDKKRDFPKQIMPSILYLVVVLLINQHMFFSSNVMLHTVNTLAGLAFFIRYYECFDEKSIRYIYDGMIVGSIFQGVFSIAGYFGYELYLDFLQMFTSIDLDISARNSGASNVVGSLGNPNLVASYFCMTIPAFLSRKKLFSLALIPLTALILSGSYMGIGSLLAGLGYYIFETKIVSKAKIYALATASMVAVPFIITSADSGRFAAWKHLLSNVSLKHWLIGSGPGWFADLKFPFPGGYLIQEHSAFLTFFNVFGLAGFIALMPIFIKYIKNSNRCALINTLIFIFFCNSFGHFTTQQSTVLIIFIPIFAVGLKNVYDND